MTDPVTSIGRITMKLLGDQWQKLAEHATVMKATVTDVAADVQLGAVDAGIVWTPPFRSLANWRPWKFRTHYTVSMPVWRCCRSANVPPRR